MSQGGNTYAPAVLLPVVLDNIAIDNESIRMGYGGADGDPLEDAAAEWTEADHRRLVLRYEPERIRQVDHVHALRRRGDLVGDGAVGMTARLRGEVDRARELLVQMGVSLAVPA